MISKGEGVNDTHQDNDHKAAIEKVCEERKRMFCNHRDTVAPAPGGSVCTKCGLFFANFTPAP